MAIAQVKVKEVEAWRYCEALITGWRRAYESPRPNLTGVLRAEHNFNSHPYPALTTLQRRLCPLVDLLEARANRVLWIEEDHWGLIGDEPSSDEAEFTQSDESEADSDDAEENDSDNDVDSDHSATDRPSAHPPMAPPGRWLVDYQSIPSQKRR